MLLIIYKYIEIIESQGYERQYFDNFINYKKNKQILDFKKQNFQNIDKSFQEKIINN